MSKHALTTLVLGVGVTFTSLVASAGVVDVRVPEPGMLLLMVGAVAAVGAMRKLRRGK